MGAADFTVLVRGDDPAEAFRRARDAAAHEHGHGGYTGTIAEKNDYLLVHTEPLTLEAARELAHAYLRDDADRRYTDKWGPAGCIPVRLEHRSVTLAGFSHVENREDDRAAAKAAWIATATRVLAERGELADGESVVNVEPFMYATPAVRGAYRTLLEVQATVTIAKAPGAGGRADGWLFFGFASC